MKSSHESQITIQQCLTAAINQLQPHSESARLDAQVLLALVLNKSQTYLYTWPDRALSNSDLKSFQQLLERRISGEPIAYITGVREFWGMPIKVSPHTLIPRPETERLVEIALELIPKNESWKIADLGTGSGAIALAIAKERPLSKIIATDISGPALTVARENKASLGLTNIEFCSGDWLNALQENSAQLSEYNLILSNPPYVASGDPHLKQGDLRFEPDQALSSGEDGLKDIRTIIEAARNYLLPGAHLLVEHGYDQATAVIDLYEKSGYSKVTCYRDYGERERATIGCWGTL